MELLTLDSDYQPAELVERYSSLVWTERYFSTGDFQLVTTDVERMIKLLPLESFVTVRDSTVPMVVEVHKIEKSKDGPPKLTVGGRSFESILDRRVAVMFQNGIGTPRVVWLENAAKEADAAYQAIRKTIGDGVLAPLNSPNDAFSMVDLIVPVDYGEYSPGAPEVMTDYEVKPGNLYTSAMELMSTNHHALKAVRPELGSNKVVLEIYNGADLTNQVVFDARFDQFEDSTYLLSNAGSADWAYVSSANASQTVSKTQSPEPSGLDRRVIYLDLSGEEHTDSEEVRRTRGLIELYKLNVTALYEGKLNEQFVAGFNRDYFLGDIIRLDGEYGLSQNVRVSEFIRSDDSTGSRAYPTFEAVI